jgi:molybdate transport system permease protein
VSGSPAFRVLLVAALAAGLIFLTLPVVAIFADTSPGRLLHSLDDATALAALGPNGLLGGALHDAGIQLVLETSGVVVALVFVASPFYLRQAEAAFSAVPPSVVQASRTLGAGEAGTFLRVVVPAARSGLVAGGALAWGRALGEFGATLMFAGSFRGVTQTVPLAIYDRFSQDFPGALALSAVLVCVSFALLLSVKIVTGRGALGVAGG